LFLPHTRSPRPGTDIATPALIFLMRGVSTTPHSFMRGATLGPAPNLRGPSFQHAMLKDFEFQVNLVAVVRVRAADESVARERPRRSQPLGSAELRLANQNNFANN
jgi:hypothetical protein